RAAAAVRKVHMRHRCSRARERTGACRPWHFPLMRWAADVNPGSPNPEMLPRRRRPATGGQQEVTTARKWASEAVGARPCLARVSPVSRPCLARVSSSDFAAEHGVERTRPAAANQEMKHHNGPEQWIFDAAVFPMKAELPMVADDGDDQEND